MKRLALSITMFLLLVGFALTVVASDNVIKVGKKGDIQISQDTKIGDVTLKPGHYQIQHRVSGSDHFVQFTAFKGHDSVRSWGPASPQDAGQIKCQIEPLANKARTTEVLTLDDAGTRRITRVVIQGENVAHVF